MSKTSKGLSGHSVRNPMAIAAFCRNGAGYMKDRREDRQGTRNDFRDLIAKYGNEEEHHEDDWADDYGCED
jgi:hypothetical protein